ncbi:phage major capsid protein [Terriglobus albidus]|uniref:Phage major capsid protein n=1 Tax=Terriglobus albidus TaxID=1592106 RepID=A0A5B9EBM1_9BACT|nr:phage major capsid protein [Terriglobus albidus]QEE28575.1 phage major capsid protein [Terriglobus albidus]
MPTPNSLDLELKNALATLKEGIANAAPKSQLEELQKQVDFLDIKLAEKHSADISGPSFSEKLKENEDVARLLRDRKGVARINLSGKDFADFERKTTITSAAVGQAVSGVLQIDRIPGITQEARQVLKVRDLLSAAPTSMQVVDFVKVNTPMNIASPVVEASTKPENAVTFTSVSEKVRTIATWIPATKQILDDFVELNSFIGSTLPYYVNLEEELQLLSGDNTGENLHGLITQASSFNTGLLSPTKGWNKIDIVGRAIQQITASKELDPTFIILHPNDWFEMRLTKDSFGRYILGDPQTNARPSLFGLDVVYTTSITNGTFLVGSGSPIASQIRDRMEMQVEISTEHQDYFVKNLVAVRAEKRLVLVVKRPASYVTGTFSSSPA